MSLSGLDDQNTVYGSLYDPVTRTFKPFSKGSNGESILDSGPYGQGVISAVTGPIGFGRCFDAVSTRAAFWQNGTLHLIGPTDGFEMVEAYGGAPDTAIYGYARSGTEEGEVMLRNGTMTPLPFPHHQFEQGRGVAAANAKGKAVGFDSFVPTIISNPLSWDFGVLTVHPAFEDYAYAVDVNDNGEFVVNSSDNGGYHYSRVFSNGVWTRLPGLQFGGNGVLGGAINDRGTVVGRVDRVVGTDRGMSVWTKDGTYSRYPFLDLVLFNPGWEITELTDINNKGVILGRYKSGSLSKYFLAKPLSRSAGS